MMTKNQLHTPKLKYNEQQKVRLYLKSGGSTMLIAKGMTSLAATSLSLFIRDFCKKHGSKLEGTFLQTK